MANPSLSYSISSPSADVPRNPKGALPSHGERALFGLAHDTFAIQFRVRGQGLVRQPDLYGPRTAERPERVPVPVKTSRPLSGDGLCTGQQLSFVLTSLPPH
jgi:hypothetical protein